MNTAPIPVAIIGLGAVADSHIAAYRTLPEVKIVAVVDTAVTTPPCSTSAAHGSTR